MKPTTLKSTRILLVFCIVASIASSAQTFTSLVSFDGIDGQGPAFMTLLQGFDGNFYGTTTWGGTSNNCKFGCGTVFSVTSDGTLTTLYSFDFTDGAYPNAGLVQASNGDLYGTTEAGGGVVMGRGTVFKITTGGKLTTLHSFHGADGIQPTAALVQGVDGNFYGTTYLDGRTGHGTVFRITPAGDLTTLLNFDGTNGAGPFGALIQAPDGSFYGTTYGGGSRDLGTVFKINRAGALASLHSFQGIDGEFPVAALIRATNGYLYGVTSGGGNAGLGTVYRITPGGRLTTLHSFDGTDGVGPFGALVQATDGDIYGTTAGGYTNYGIIFRIAADGTLTTLHTFNGTDGSGPEGALIQATNGNLYGTTTGGGAYGYGTVFSLDTSVAALIP